MRLKSFEEIVKALNAADVRYLVAGGLADRIDIEHLQLRQDDMDRSNEADEAAAWQAGTWDGARREAMRRWARLPLERIIAAQEEMEELPEELSRTGKPNSTGGA